MKGGAGIPHKGAAGNCRTLQIPKDNSVHQQYMTIQDVAEPVPISFYMFWKNKCGCILNETLLCCADLIDTQTSRFLAALSKFLLPLASKFQKTILSVQLSVGFYFDRLPEMDAFTTPKRPKRPRVVPGAPKKKPKKTMNSQEDQGQAGIIPRALVFSVCFR